MKTGVQASGCLILSAAFLFAPQSSRGYTIEGISREYSVFNFGSPSASAEAISREVSVFNRGTYTFDAISREASVLNYGFNHMDLALGSIAVRAGDTSAVPITVFNLAPITNLQFAFDFPPGLLTNWTVQPLAPFTGSLSVSNGGRLYVTLTPAIGQSFVSTQQLGQIGFLAISNQPSAFLPLPIADASGPRPDGTDTPFRNFHDGEVAVIHIQSLLRALAESNGQRHLTLYGLAGTNYTIESATNLSPPTAWMPVLSLTPSATMILSTSDLGSSNAAIFYRARQ